MNDLVINRESIRFERKVKKKVTEKRRHKIDWRFQIQMSLWIKSKQSNYSSSRNLVNRENKRITTYVCVRWFFCWLHTKKRTGSKSELFDFFFSNWNLEIVTNRHQTNKATKPNNDELSFFVMVITSGRYATNSWN